ncbi:MAG: hydrolase [Rhodospirillales bacterium]|nr:hydrolase [Rhodospirillales bacterium]
MGMFGGSNPRSPAGWAALARPRGGMGGDAAYPPEEIERMQRCAVAAEAGSWIGTPYHHCADIKGVGVDCAMILVRIFVDTGMVPAFDPRPYPSDWHMHQATERYLDAVLAYAHEVETPGVGDIALYRFGLTRSHSAIVLDWPSVIHAQLRVGCIASIATRDEPLASRTPRFFSLWPAASSLVGAI